MKTSFFAFVLTSILALSAQAHVRMSDSITYLPVKTTFTSVPAAVFVQAQSALIVVQDGRIVRGSELRQGNYCQFSFPKSDRNRNLKMGTVVELVSVAQTKDPYLKVKLAKDNDGTYEMSIVCAEARYKTDRESGESKLVQEPIKDLSIAQMKTMLAPLFNMQLSATIDF